MVIESSTDGELCVYLIVHRIVPVVALWERNTAISRSVSESLQVSILPCSPSSTGQIVHVSFGSTSRSRIVVRVVEETRHPRRNSVYSQANIRVALRTYVAGHFSR